MKRKGFIYTLEAIIAASLFLGTVTIIIPQLESGSSEPRNLQQSLHKGLQTLDRSGDLRDNLSRAEIEKELGRFVPSSYNHTVLIGLSSYREEDIDPASGPNLSFKRTGDSFEAQFWVSNASSLNISFAGKRIVESYSGGGYLERELGTGQGNMSFSAASGDVYTRFNNYSLTGELPNASSVKNINYVLHHNGSKEVRVSLWQEE